MRNLIQYPISADEITTYLQQLEDELTYDKTGLLGDLRPLMLSTAKIAVLINEKLISKIENLEAQLKEAKSNGLG